MRLAQASAVTPATAGHFLHRVVFVRADTRLDLVMCHNRAKAANRYCLVYMEMHAHTYTKICEQTSIHPQCKYALWFVRCYLLHRQIIVRIKKARSHYDIRV